MAGIILSSPRTGSEFLVRSLKQHPEIRCESELLKTIPSSEQREFLRKMAQDGVWHKVFYFDLTPVSVMQIKRMNLSVIHLCRPNIARQVVSWAIKTQMTEQEFLSKACKEEPHERKFRIEKLDWLTDRVQDIVHGRNFMERIFPHAFTLAYPHFIKDNAVKDYEKVCKFIGVKPLPLKCDMKKQMPKDYTTIIENYAEVIDALGVQKL